MQVLIVTFQLADLSPEEFAAHCFADVTTRSFATLPEATVQTAGSLTTISA